MLGDGVQHPPPWELDSENSSVVYPWDSASQIGTQSRRLSGVTKVLERSHLPNRSKIAGYDFALLECMHVLCAACFGAQKKAAEAALPTLHPPWECTPPTTNGTSRPTKPLREAVMLGINYIG
ncbi:hypothetical protein EV182_000829 [Spiromyces aspiralis]|uniref:Uncharacterized protein n=1 Tax=Spiromyces aspiralis TaxID=68401 RepID=A0ACC1HHJ6_9FUNG|nr:hypothetical protein EV182_000829 [Spiromyces aspiralis]